jgi:release factor H-coupled RctB family protein
MEARVRLLASSESWIESEALRQLYAVSRYERVRLAVGFPDLHPGKGGPVGAAFVTEGVIYPGLIGGDIGCGMALFKTDLVQRDIALNRWAGQHFDLEHAWEGDVSEFLAEWGLESSGFDQELGTIGGGNHFAELQCIEEVRDATALKGFGLGKQQLAILVHSGSRGLGDSILGAYADEHQAGGSAPDSGAAMGYLRGHDTAVRWAEANRSLIARRFAEALGVEAELLWDGCHNSITPYNSRASQRDVPTSETVWVHRKGAVATFGGPVIIPGSRGSLSYLVKPLGEGADRAWSLAHGAGRKWARSETRLRMRERFGVRQLTQTGLGGRVICEQRELLYEEAPEAYKNIETVIDDLVNAGLVSVIATFRPLLTYKCRSKNVA